MSTSSQCADESIKSIPKGTVQQKIQDVFNKSEEAEKTKMPSSESKYSNIHYYSFNPLQTPDLVNTRPPSARDFSAKPGSNSSQSSSTPTNADKLSKTSVSKKPATTKTVLNKGVDTEYTPVNEEELEDVFNRNEDPNDLNPKFKGKPEYKQRILFQFDDRSIERYNKELREWKVKLQDYEKFRVTESSPKKSPNKQSAETQKQEQNEQHYVSIPQEKAETKKSESKSSRNSKLVRSEETYESLKTPTKQSDKVSTKSTKTSSSTDENEKTKCTIVKLDEMENFHSLEANNELDDDSASQVSLQKRSQYSELRKCSDTEVYSTRRTRHIKQKLCVILSILAFFLFGLLLGSLLTKFFFQCN